MKKLIIPDKVQKEMLTDFMIANGTRGLIGGYCEDEFPVYYANEEMALMLGYDAVEKMVKAIDGKVINTIHPDDREQVIKDIGGEYYEGLTYETTYRMPRKDGSWFWTVDKGKVIRTEDGKLAIISACYDMTSFVERHKKLEEQNMLSKATIDQIPGGYHRCSLEEGHPFLYISDRFLAIFGWTREEIKTIFDNKFDNMLHPDDRNLSSKYVVRILDTCGHGFAQDQIYRLLGKDGYHWVTDATTLVKSGNKRFFQGNITDITDFVNDKEKKEKELEDSNRILNEQNRVLSALSRDYTTVLLCDLKQDTFEVVKGDPSFAHNAPAKKQQLVHGSNCYSERIRYFFENILIKESAPEYLEILLPEHLMNKLKETDNIEFYHKTIPNGNGFRHFLTRAIRLYNDEEHFKIILGFYSVDEIIKKEQEIELQREIIEGLGKEYFSVLAVELDEDRVFSYRESGKNGKIISDFCRKCGNRWSKIIPSYAETMVSDNTNGEFENQLGLKVLRSQEEDYSMTYEFKSETGINYHQVRVVYVKKKDGTRMAVVGTRNIDSLIKKERMQEEKLKKAYAAAENANKAKTEFLNNMSHDIRTPMNAIIGFTALAAAHMDQPDLVKDYLAKIGTSGQHLLSLINDVLDMSRIESGNVKIEEKEVCIPDILHDLKTIIQGNIQAKQQNLYIDRQDVVHENVITDRLRLNQILLNIVSNAIKFTPVGGMINIRVSEKPCNRKGFTAFEFRIRDNGIGMSEKFQEHVFDSFSRERSSTQSGIKGTGLGMAITRNIVDMMGGTISLTSKEGKGTEFVVILNFKTLEKATVYGPIPELIGARALVVDDDVHTCTSVSKMLREIEMRADWSTSGKEAVIRAKEAFEQNDAFKAYIIDWLMPDMNGIETVRRIRAVIGDETPIIILTAYDWADIEQEAREAGVTAFVEKPIFMSELRKVLTKPMGIKEEPSQQAERENRHSGKKILLVEDNELNREIATALLEEIGISVDCVEDGTDAVERMNEVADDQYDLIFMDIQMPKMDGYMTTREIRTLKNNKKANIPIVAMTANAFEEDKEKSFNAGMNAHIAKPIDIKTILAAFDQVFGTS